MCVCVCFSELSHGTRKHGMDWGTVDVYVCSAGCQNSQLCEEYVQLQHVEHGKRAAGMDAPTVKTSGHHADPTKPTTTASAGPQSKPAIPDQHNQ